jgi:hypothetical protein
MRPTTTTRTRRRLASREPGTPQTEKRKEPTFFGAQANPSFFPPVATLHRSPEPAAAEEKEKVSRAPEKPEEEKVARASEERKDEAISRVPEEKKEEVQRAPQDPEKEKEGAVQRVPEEKQEEKVSRKAEGTAAGGRTTDYVRSISGRGEPLPEAERKWFGDRMGFDFESVRVHTGPEAEASARDVGAKAYAVGRHVVFGEGRYRPESSEGRHLLAHELAHVVQNGGARPGSVQREVGDRTAAAAPPPTDPVVFRNRLSIALGQMTTPTVVGETLGGTLEPVLRDLAANARWIDPNGVSSGGAEVAVGIPGPGHRTIRLVLILDDDPHPPLAGRFDATGPDSGSIRVYQRENPNADTLATTLYHECLHLMGWLARGVPGGDLVAQTGATGGRRATLEDIDPSRHPRHLAEVRRRVSDLAASVNATRSVSDQVGATGVDRASSSLLEEYLVRIETEVFRLMRDSDAAARAPVASLRIGTSADTFFPRGDVEKYLFEIGSVFRAADRAVLEGSELGGIDDLHAYFRDRVQHFVGRRYSEVVHGPEFP